MYVISFCMHIMYTRGTKGLIRRFFVRVHVDTWLSENVPIESLLWWTLHVPSLRRWLLRVKSTVRWLPSLDVEQEIMFTAHQFTVFQLHKPVGNLLETSFSALSWLGQQYRLIRTVLQHAFFLDLFLGRLFIAMECYVKCGVIMWFIFGCVSVKWPG